MTPQGDNWYKMVSDTLRHRFTTYETAWRETAKNVLRGSLSRQPPEQRLRVWAGCIDDVAKKVVALVKAYFSPEIKPHLLAANEAWRQSHRSTLPNRIS